MANEGKKFEEDFKKSFLGTQLDNIHDMINKERGGFGGKPPSFTREEILKIRKMYSETSASMRQLEEIFKVSKSTISAIVNRKVWFDINE